jgi:hypothetical protein
MIPAPVGTMAGAVRFRGEGLRRECRFIAWVAFGYFPALPVRQRETVVGAPVR